MHTIRVFGHYMRLPLLLLVLVESLVFGFSFVVGSHLRWWMMDGVLAVDPLPLVGYEITVGLIFTLSMASMGLYEVSAREGLTGVLIRVVVSLTLGSMALATLAFIFPGLALWRSILALTVVIAFIAICGLRTALYYAKPSFFRRRVLVFGASSLVGEIIRNDSAEVLVVGVIPASDEAAVTIPPERIRLDRPSEASDDLNRLLDKPGIVA
ncbi:sugar transferase, partial [Thiorhodococcus mannitoliphagus]|nr:sugar transferase [Thiorhodococcus mannitoliphagus]